MPDDGLLDVCEEEEAPPADLFSEFLPFSGPPPVASHPPCQSFCSFSLSMPQQSQSMPPQTMSFGMSANGMGGPPPSVLTNSFGSKSYSQPQSQPQSEPVWEESKSSAPITHKKVMAM